jgi:hypothetical protein
MSKKCMLALPFALILVLHAPAQARSWGVEVMFFPGTLENQVVSDSLGLMGFPAGTQVSLDQAVGLSLGYYFPQAYGAL